MVNLLKLITGKQDFNGRNLILNEEINYDGIISIINKLDDSVMIDVKYYRTGYVYSFTNHNSKDVCGFLEDKFKNDSKAQYYLFEGRHKIFSKNGDEKNILQLRTEHVSSRAGDEIVLGGKKHSAKVTYISKNN